MSVAQRLPLIVVAALAFGYFGTVSPIRAQTAPLIAAASRVVDGEDMSATIETLSRDASLAPSVRALFAAPASRKVLTDELGAHLQRLFIEKMTLEQMNAVSDYTLSPLGRSAMRKVNTDNDTKLTAAEIAAYQKFAAQPIATLGLANFEAAKAEFKTLGPLILPQLVEKLKQSGAIK